MTEQEGLNHNIFSLFRNFLLTWATFIHNAVREGRTLNSRHPKIRVLLNI